MRPPLTIPDKIGKQFGQLKIVEHLGLDPERGNIFRCRCECGNFKVASFGMLNNGALKSCGCLRRRNAKRKAKEIEDGPHPELRTIDDFDKRIKWEYEPASEAELIAEQERKEAEKQSALA